MAQWAEVPDLFFQEAVGYIRCQALGQVVRETLEEGLAILLCPKVWPVSRRHQCMAPHFSAFLLAPHNGAGSVLPGLTHRVLPGTGCLFLPAVLMTFLVAKQITSLLAFVPSTRSRLQGPV